MSPNNVIFLLNMKYSPTKKEEEKGANTDVSKAEDLLVSWAGVIQTDSPPHTSKGRSM